MVSAAKLLFNEKWKFAGQLKSYHTSCWNIFLWVCFIGVLWIVFYSFCTYLYWCYNNVLLNDFLHFNNETQRVHKSTGCLLNVYQEGQAVLADHGHDAINLHNTWLPETYLHNIATATSDLPSCFLQFTSNNHIQNTAVDVLFERQPAACGIEVHFMHNRTTKWHSEFNLHKIKHHAIYIFTAVKF